MFWVTVLPPPPLGVALVVLMLWALPGRVPVLMPVPVTLPVLRESAPAWMPAVVPVPDPEVEPTVEPRPVAAVVVAAEPEEPVVGAAWVVLALPTVPPVEVVVPDVPVVVPVVVPEVLVEPLTALAIEEDEPETCMRA
jgi:hypothetical protein